MTQLTFEFETQKRIATSAGVIPSAVDGHPAEADDGDIQAGITKLTSLHFSCFLRTIESRAQPLAGAPSWGIFTAYYKHRNPWRGPPILLWTCRFRDHAGVAARSRPTSSAPRNVG
ncbi:MAG: hypothetical protein ACR2RL_22030, partial [Gammaproteobacteria bacterium]